eukprot:TRINITY_DN4321_c0_g1_i2.p1 TRINITY_DN4321_c0_g1~~TRINITY_DN4321_c0_g1_i2.p1  ORF type:complete len:349 (-),score=59.74 TRINITY_DN4321_c0_g1_i2:32-1078(-)
MNIVSRFRDEDEDARHWYFFRYKLEMEQKLIIIFLVLQLLLCGVLYIFYIMGSFGIVVITQYFFAYHSILKGNPFEMSAFLVMSFMTWSGVLFKSLRYMDKVRQIGGSDWVVYSIIAVDVLLSLLQISYPYLAYKSYQSFRRRIYKRLGASIQLQNTYKNFEIYRSMTKLFGALTGMEFFIIIYMDLRVSPAWLTISLDTLAGLLILSLIFLGYRGASGVRSFVYAFLGSACLHLGYRIARLVLYLYRLPELHVTYYDLAEKLRKPRINISVSGLIVEALAIGVFFFLVIYGEKNVEAFKTQAFDKVVNTKGNWRNDAENSQSLMQNQVNPLEQMSAQRLPGLEEDFD